MAGKPKAPFYLALALVVLGLVMFAYFRSDVIAPKGGTAEPVNIDPRELGQLVEEPSADGITTVKEYTIKPAERLPPVTGISSYSALEDNTVRFALNVWAGWAPIILANEGLAPGKVWKTPDGSEFKLELALIDNPIAMRDAYATGNVHIGWATLDMVPLFIESFRDNTGRIQDSRIMPRIFQQVDWSNGGDGIVVREAVRTVANLRGQKLVLAQNSPSHYFALNMLVAGGVQPGEVEMIFTEDAFQAAAAFNRDKSIAGAVSWAPDIYNLADVPGNRMLVTTGTANKLIADVWFARADFAKDHPGIIEALVRGIFDGIEALHDPQAKQRCAELMAAAYNIPASDTIQMFADAHNTNWAENYQFFLNENNPTNFERVWNQAYYLYRKIGSIRNSPVPFDQVMDFSIIKKLQGEEKYASQQDTYRLALTPKTVSTIQAESDEILTNTVVIHFYPNSWDLYKKVAREEGQEPALYDPSVDAVLRDVAQLAGQFGAARIVIEGHTDGSMRNQVPAELVRELSLNRANAVKEALVESFQLEPNQFAVAGLGWDRPADPQDPNDHVKNRRVEIKVYSAERE